MRIVFVILFVFLSLPQQAVGARLSTETIGGCLVFTFRGISPLSPSIRERCERSPLWDYGRARTFSDQYTWVGPSLALSFEQAEQALSNSRLAKAVKLIVVINVVIRIIFITVCIVIAPFPLEHFSEFFQFIHQCF